jgi:hypothetical protein
MYLEVEEAWHVLLGAAVAVYCVLIKTYWMKWKPELR